MDGFLPPPTGNALELVQLDQDHPGFRDPEYRKRRNAIAQLALAHRPGDEVPDVEYSALEHFAWQTAIEHLEPLHQRYACRTFLERWPTLNLPRDRVPQLREVNPFLARTTGFRMEPVAGLVAAKAFFSSLATGVFLSTQYIRHHSAPLYTPEPDVVHELVGHVALLSDPSFARVNRLFGEVAATADVRTTEQLIRVYWYALEFGVTREQGQLRVVGAGLLSSFGELGRLESGAELRPFNLEEIARTPYDPTCYQKVLFVADGTGPLLSGLTNWLNALARHSR